MRRAILLALTLSYSLSGGFKAYIFPITEEIEKRMRRGNSYRDGCPVPLSKLRYIRLNYIGFDNKEHTGELIVHKSVAIDVANIFKELYDIRYPIYKMRLISEYNGSDFKSIEADNTSAFNCRFIDNTKRWSKHSYGKAIDINPIENPYVYSNGKTSHRKSIPFLKRVRVSNTPPYRAMILKQDKSRKIFTKYGWGWGGYFKRAKDYQHFYKK